MRAPSQTWECAYSASRRKHHHRCMVCRRIIAEGEPVFMLRQDRGSKAVHADPCADREHSPGTTYGEAFELWGVHRNARLGYADAKAIVNTHPFLQAKGALGAFVAAEEFPDSYLSDRTLRACMTGLREAIEEATR